MGTEENNLETNEDLQAFIADLEAQKAPEPVVEEVIEETVDGDNTESDSSAPSGDVVPGGDGSTEGSTSGEEEIVEAAEPKPVSERLDEVKKELGVPDDGTPEADLEKQENQLQAATRQLQQVDILAGLPQAGVFAPEGKPIYQMDANEINHYLIKLRDSGRELEAGQVQQAYMSAVQNVSTYVEQQRALQQQQQNLRQKKDYTEWQQCRAEWLKKLPEVEAHIPTVAQHLDRKAAQDPVFAFQLESYNGKMKAILQAFRDLGIDKELTKGQPKAEIKSPSAPDARAASKKVQTHSSQTVPFTAEQIEKMTQAEYLNHEAVIDKQMAQGLIK